MMGRSSFGFLGRFGRSGDLKAFDVGLRQCDVHESQIVDGVKLAAVRQVQAHAPAENLSDDAYHDAAYVIGFCIKGEQRITELLGSDQAQQLASRIEQAVDEPDGLDASLLLLALHAGLVAPAVAEQFDLAIDQA